MDGQLKKGVLEMCLLHLISQGDAYGYELIQLSTRAFPDVLNSTVYTILRRLSSGGYITTYQGEASEGPPRKYYKITSEGISYLRESIQDWDNLCTAVKQIGI